MTSAQLTKILSEKLNRSQQDIENLFSAFAEVVTDACSNSDSVAIPRFGNINATLVPEYIGESNGKKILFPPAISVNFVASTILCNKIKEANS